MSANTKLLLHCNGTDASTSFPDETGSHSVTANGTAELDTAQSKFGGASCLLDGNSDYLSIPDSSDWYFGTGDFTVEAWIRPASNSGEMIYSQCEDGSNRLVLYLEGGYLKVYYIGSGGSIWLGGGTTTVTTGTWHHAALVRNGNVWTAYLDGISVDSDTFGGAVDDFSATATIGKQELGGSEYWFDGHIDEVRVSNIARWTSNFTPPSSEYSYTSQSGGLRGNQRGVLRGIGRGL